MPNLYANKMQKISVLNKQADKLDNEKKRYKNSIKSLMAKLDSIDEISGIGDYLNVTDFQSQIGRAHV